LDRSNTCHHDPQPAEQRVQLPPSTYCEVITKSLRSVGFYSRPASSTITKKISNKTNRYPGCRHHRLTPVLFYSATVKSSIQTLSTKLNQQVRLISPEKSVSSRQLLPARKCNPAAERLSQYAAYISRRIYYNSFSRIVIYKKSVSSLIAYGRIRDPL